MEYVLIGASESLAGPPPKPWIHEELELARRLLKVKKTCQNRIMVLILQYFKIIQKKANGWDTVELNEEVIARNIVESSIEVVTYRVLP